MIDDCCNEFVAAVSWPERETQAHREPVGIAISQTNAFSARKGELVDEQPAHEWVCHRNMTIAIAAITEVRISAAAASWVDFQLKLQVCRLNQIQGLTGGVTRRDFIISMGVNVPPDIRRMVKDTVQRTLKLVV